MRKRHLAALIVVAVMALMAAAPAQSDIKYSQPPEPSDLKVFYGWNEESVWGEPQPQVVADDWMCEAPGPVTDIHWWGSFLGWTSAADPPMMPDAFRITIWTNVAAGVDQPFSHPGEVIWEIYCTDFTHQWVGWDYDPRNPGAGLETCFRFEQILDPEEYFHQEWYGSGNIYWVSIAAVYSFGNPTYRFGWKTRERFFEDDAVAITDPTDPMLGSIYAAGQPIEYPTGVSWDVSFELTTEPVGVKWDQPPTYNPDSDHPECFWGWDEQSIYEHAGILVDQIVADDWMCEDERPITDIHWWGSYYAWPSTTPPDPGSPEDVFAFRIAIWTDVPAGTDPLQLHSHPGQLIYQWTVPRDQLNETYVGCDYHPDDPDIVDNCFYYSFQIDELQWFYQEEPGTIYWISICALYTPSAEPWWHPWGWKTREHNFQDDAVRIFDPTAPGVVGDEVLDSEPIEDLAGNTWDMAFRITTEPDTIKWDQPALKNNPDPYHEDDFYGWDEESIYEWTQIVADDWLCEDERPITDIHWWGSYMEWDPNTPPAPGSPEDVDSFHISIWTDVPAGTDPLQLHSHPGKLIHQWSVFRWELNETYVGDDYHPEHYPESCFYYSFLIPESEWFYQEEPGTIYWISISAQYIEGDPDLHPWGWKTREHNFQDDAVRIWDPTAPGLGDEVLDSEPIIDTLGNSWDMAFRITTEPDKVKWSQPPVPHGETFDGWNDPSVYDHASYPIDADDWPCNTDQFVSDIHWWGSFIGWSEDVPPWDMPDKFHIAIWTDMPSPPEPFSRPDKVVWETWCDNFTWEFVGWDIDPRYPDHIPEACFKFEQDLDMAEWFRQDPGTNNIYWLSIAAMYDAGATVYHPWGWKTRPWYFQDDAVRIFDPTAPGIDDLYILGSPIEYPQGTSWDMAFVLTTPPVGTLWPVDTGLVTDHYGIPGDASRKEMLSLAVWADPVEDISWDTITLTASGTGNDWSDITVVEVYIDNAPLGQVDAGDVLIGSGTYVVDNDTIVLALAPAPIILAYTSMNALISYTMAPAYNANATYQLEVAGASGTGQTSLQPVAVNLSPSPLMSAVKTMGPAPISIGQAKLLLPIGQLISLQGKVLTADFRTTTGLFYIEEEKRSAGSGVIATAATPASLNIGDRVSLVGTTSVLAGSELIFTPAAMSVTGGDAIGPVGMNNKWSGGQVFGGQPGLSDDGVGLPPAYGLSNVGILLRVFGEVTGHGLAPVPDAGGMMVAEDAIWLDDGSLLRDGFLLPPTWVKWSQPPIIHEPPDIYYGWNEKSVYGSDQIVADDWACETEQPVTDIHWWGSYIGWNDPDPPPGEMPIAFRITIWTDVPKGPGEPFSHPDRVKWQTYCDNFTWEFAGWDYDPRDPAALSEACFKFEQDLTEAQWFRQDPGVHIYWISIAAVYPAGVDPPVYPWGWKTRLRDLQSKAPDDAVRIFNPTAPVVGSDYILGEPIWWPNELTSWDMAFELTSRWDTRGIAVLAPDPLNLPSIGSYWGATGIMWAIPNPLGLPVRLLVPRDSSDMTSYPLSP